MGGRARGGGRRAPHRAARPPAVRGAVRAGRGPGAGHGGARRAHGGGLPPPHRRGRPRRRAGAGARRPARARRRRADAARRAHRVDDLRLGRARRGRRRCGSSRSARASTSRPDLVRPVRRRGPRPGAGRRRRDHDQRAVGRGERPARRHGRDPPHPHARPDRPLRLGRRRPEGPDPAAVGGRDRADARVGRPAVRGAGKPGVRPALPGHRGEPPRVRPARRHPGRGRRVRPGLRGRGGRGAAVGSWPRSCRRGCTARARTATRRRGRPSAPSSSA